MSDEKPELTKTEMRQGNSRKMNFRVLAIGLVAIIVIFGVVMWFSTATQDETATGLDAGASVEEPAGPADDSLDETPLPTPDEENLVQ